MRIGIIGSGRMGRTLALHLARAGHDAMIANSRGPESLEGLVGEIAGHVGPVRVDQAVQLAEVVFLAIPHRAVGEVAAAGEPWDDKVVVDVTNRHPQRDGPEVDPGAESSSSLVARRLENAHVVKAFNTLWFERLANEARPGGGRRLAVPVAADDGDAKQLVMALVDEIGFEPVDAGTLADGKRQEPGTPVYNQALDADGVRAALARA
jgi:predicted dinucleotide-binding enzyme